jgi:hypothetical protein
MNIEYYKLSDGFYKVSDIGENEIRITWVKEDWDDEDDDLDDDDDDLDDDEEYLDDDEEDEEEDKDDDEE